MNLYNEQKALMPANDKRYCVPIALAIVSDKSAADISTDMISKGMRRRGQGVYSAAWRYYCENILQVKLTAVTSRVREAGGKTVNSVEKVLDPKCRYLITVRGHVLAYSEGKIQDWTQGGRCRLQTVYRIDPLDAESKPAAPIKKPKVNNIKLECWTKFDHMLSVKKVAEDMNITYANAHYYYQTWKKRDQK